VIFFLKSGKTGLMPVKKQVSKKGKTFAQTFWVKPEEAAPAKAKVVSPGADSAASDKPNGFVGQTGHWNREDGFYVHYDDAAVVIPDRFIQKVIHTRGLTFVIAPVLEGHVGDMAADSSLSLTPAYRAYELRTGMAACPQRYYPEETEKALHAQLKTVSDATLKALLSTVTEIGDMEKVVRKVIGMVDTTPLTRDGMELLATELLSSACGPDKADWPVTPSEVTDWLRDTQKINTENDFKKFKGAQSFDPVTLREAVKLKLTYSCSLTRYSQMNKILVRLIETNNFSPLKNAQKLDEWAHKFANDLRYDQGLDDLHIGGMDGYDIAVYAVNHNVSTYTAEKELSDDSPEKDDEESGPVTDPTGVYDSGGNLWTHRDAHMLGNWTGGWVKQTRAMAKRIFENREAGNPDVQIGAGNSSEADALEFFNMTESHLTASPQPTLWRGTPNDAWCSAKVGDVVPIGVASFSKSKLSANEFAGAAMLILDVDETCPVSGIDVNSVAKLVHNTSVAGYEGEKEFIVMTPAVEVVDVQQIVSPPLGMYRTVVHIKTVKENLMHMMKSVFESRDALIAGMERTFDYLLHDEPEPDWEDSDDASIL